MKIVTLAASLIFIGTTGSFAQSDANSVVRQSVVESSFSELSSKAAVNGTGVSVMTFHVKDDTRGSRYAYPDWVHGSVLDTGNHLYDGKQFGLNYDKINHTVYLTDNKQVMQISPELVKSFSLVDNNGVSRTYYRVPEIKPDVFFQAIGENTGTVQVYKLITTKFEKANYTTDGMTETGKNYDEYVDNPEYYISADGGKTFSKFDIGKKSIKKAIGANPKADAFFASHKTDDVDENFVRALVENLNK